MIFLNTPREPSLMKVMINSAIKVTLALKNRLKINTITPQLGPELFFRPVGLRVLHMP